ncbi:glycosyltransferase [Candidatus Gottesmanbacteria bacterium]|nr:glycosyltransferase [Candidatus Gottesmanbacteria bacterium]
MKIGIDISQIIYEGTGVATYVRQMVRALVAESTHEYILFGSSLRGRSVFRQFVSGLPSNVRLITIPIPPSVLDFFWNRLHIIPVEWFTGPLDVFWSSDWTQPPLHSALGMTTIHDVMALLYPESFTRSIVDVHKRRLQRVARECTRILCDSEATKNDVMRLLGVSEKRLRVIYPGYS